MRLGYWLCMALLLRPVGIAAPYSLPFGLPFGRRCGLYHTGNVTPCSLCFGLPFVLGRGFLGFLPVDQLCGCRLQRFRFRGNGRGQGCLRLIGRL